MRAVLRAAGESSITAGLILLLFCAYLLWGTGVYTQRMQLQLQQELVEEHARPEPAKLRKIELGRAVAMLRIPRLGRDYHYAVVEGVDAEHLKKGPGHYPGTALPGQIGNFVISGHRTTYLAPFNRIDELQRGDEIIVDAPEARYTYRVTSQDIVYPDEVDVLASVPGKPDIEPIRAYITLSTCHPEYSAAQRLIVFGVLKKTEPRKE
ncbi:class E sortase [Nonomuraea aurantiaca]|uniref:class E sortase n=1 Tax=Nonomuraea aurantiaca TaxID=2878562 RepID=UPI001CD97865|nr:class E sortase [Nonomuraea aurantiaca]MCA2229068.1 class E sortase [Nonomuraea aurantiaca]